MRNLKEVSRRCFLFFVIFNFCVFDSHNSLSDHEPGFARLSLLCFVEYSSYICRNDVLAQLNDK